jgi:hypothetical protein
LHSSGSCSCTPTSLCGTILHASQNEPLVDPISISARSCTTSPPKKPMYHFQLFPSSKSHKWAGASSGRNHVSLRAIHVLQKKAGHLWIGTVGQASSRGLGAQARVANVGPEPIFGILFREPLYLRTFRVCFACCLGFLREPIFGTLLCVGQDLGLKHQPRFAGRV